MYVTHELFISHLVSHLDQTSQCQFEYQAAFERHKVPHVLQEKETWSIVVTVAQVGGHERVLVTTSRRVAEESNATHLHTLVLTQSCADLELGVFSGVESVHSTEPLAGGPPAQKFHLPLSGQTLSRWVHLVSLRTQRDRETERERERGGGGAQGPDL